MILNYFVTNSLPMFTGLLNINYPSAVLLVPRDFNHLDLSVLEIQYGLT